MTAAYISFRTGRSPKACGMIFVRRRSSRKRRSSKFVVRIARRCRSGKRRWAMQASKSSRKARRPPRRAADEVRARHQSEDRQSPQADDPAVATDQGGSDYRIDQRSPPTRDTLRLLVHGGEPAWTIGLISGIAVRSYTG